MDFLTFASTWIRAIVDLVVAFAWPIAFITVALIFKDDVRSRLRLLKTVDIAGVRAEFNQELAEAERIAKQLDEAAQPVGDIGGNALEPDAAPGNDAHIEHGPITSYPDNLALQYQPTGVIMETWKSVEVLLRLIFERRLSDHKSGGAIIMQPTTRKVIDLLLENGLIDKTEEGLLRRLLTMRNTAAHKLDTNLTAEDADQYQRLALVCMNLLEKKIR